MANLFDPLNWNDGPSGGTPASVDRGARRWEAGIESLDVAVDAHDNRIDALEAALQSLGITGADVMPTSERLTVVPTEGKLVVDSDLPALLIGKPGGTGWWTVTLSTLTGAGSLAGPQNMTVDVAAGGTIGQITLAANTVASAAVSGGRGPYILYEDQSPTGVTGATALATPSSVRTPGTARQYGYWFTAMVAGVETAASNRVVATLPYVAPGGGGGGSGATGTPAQILNIGTGSTQNHFNVGVGYSTGHVDKTQQMIIDGYAESPYFQPNAAGNAVAMRVYANGKTTSSSTIHPRVELRELMTTDANKAAWNGASGTHVMSGTSTVTPPARRLRDVQPAEALDLHRADPRRARRRGPAADRGHREHARAVRRDALGEQPPPGGSHSLPGRQRARGQDRGPVDLQHRQLGGLEDRGHQRHLQDLHRRRCQEDILNAFRRNVL
jgi:hypothetical protein